jgi:hypothetical protein
MDRRKPRPSLPKSTSRDLVPLYMDPECLWVWVHTASDYAEITDHAIHGFHHPSIVRQNIGFLLWDQPAG